MPILFKSGKKFSYVAIFHAEPFLECRVAASQRQEEKNAGRVKALFQAAQLSVKDADQRHPIGINLRMDGGKKPEQKMEDRGEEASCPAAQLSVAMQTSGTAYGKLRCRGKPTVWKGWPGRKPIHSAEYGRPVEI